MTHMTLMNKHSSSYQSVFSLFRKRRGLKKVFGTDIVTLVQHEKSRRDRIAFKRQQAQQKGRVWKNRKKKRKYASVFDVVPYTDIVNDVPEIVQFLCDAMRKRPATQGLFRESGSMMRINAAMVAVDSGMKLL